MENLKVLLAENPDLVSSKDSDGWTPLHWAAREGNNDIAEFVLTNKADVNAQNNEGWTPLHVAIFMGQKDIQQLLLQHGGQDLMPQAIAPRDTNIATAEAVLDTAIHDAASEGNLARGKELLSEKPDRINSQDARGWSPLDFAVREGHEDVVKLLLDRKANVNLKTHSGWTPLHFAASHGYYRLVKLLFANSADVNARDAGGETPLQIAASRSGTEVVGLLLANRADAGTTNYMGWTALHYAAGTGSNDVVALLLANKADVNAKNNTGETPLQRAVLYKRKDMVSLLLANGADINAKDLDGNTALMDPESIFIVPGAKVTRKLFLNQSVDHTDIVKLLLDHGTDVSAKNFLGATAMSKAVAWDDKDVVELLRQHGAYK